MPCAGPPPRPQRRPSRRRRPRAARHCLRGGRDRSSRGSPRTPPACPSTSARGAHGGRRAWLPRGRRHRTPRIRRTRLRLFRRRQRRLHRARRCRWSRGSPRTRRACRATPARAAPALAAPGRQQRRATRHHRRREGPTGRWSRGSPRTRRACPSTPARAAAVAAATPPAAGAGSSGRCSRGLPRRGGQRLGPERRTLRGQRLQRRVDLVVRGLDLRRPLEMAPRLGQRAVDALEGEAGALREHPALPLVVAAVRLERGAHAGQRAAQGVGLPARHLEVVLHQSFGAPRQRRGLRGRCAAAGLDGGRHDVGAVGVAAAMTRARGPI